MNDLILLVVVRQVVTVGKLGHHGGRDAVLQVLQTRAAGVRQHLLRLNEGLSWILRDLRDDRRLLHGLAAHNLTGLHDFGHRSALLLDQLRLLLLRRRLRLLLDTDAGLGGGQTIGRRCRLLGPHVANKVGHARGAWSANSSHQRDPVGSSSDSFLSARCTRLPHLDRYLRRAYHRLMRLLGQNKALLILQVGHHLGADGDALRLLLLLQQVLNVGLIGLDDLEGRFM
jgi:hypothetical protein